MDEFGNHKLRRAWLSGYRVADVEILRAQLVLRMTQLTTELQAVRARLDSAESERRDLARRLDDAHRQEIALSTRLAAVEAERDRALAQAATRATGVLGDAEVDAVRIRGEAALEAERVRGQVEELLRLRGRLADAIRHIGGEMERVMADGAATPSAAAPEPRRHIRPVITPSPAEPPATPPADLYANRVEIDAGPFADLASLSVFEASLGRLPKVENVYIRRFHGEHATIEVELDQPTPLLDDMAQRMPFGLSVEHVADDRIAVTISEGKEAL